MKKVIDKTLFKFIIIGVINTLLGMAIMFGLYNLAGVSYWVSTAANYVIVSFLSFYLNKRFTFQFKGGAMKSGLRFALNIGICYIFAYGIAKPWVMTVLGGQIQSTQENAAMLVGMCLFTGFNYFGQKWFVFADRDREELGKSRSELEAELKTVMALPDDENVGCYYDHEADSKRRKEAIREACGQAIGVAAEEHVEPNREESSIQSTVCRNK